jgi:hypothetical protein
MTHIPSVRPDLISHYIFLTEEALEDMEEYSPEDVFQAMVEHGFGDYDECENTFIRMEAFYDTCDDASDFIASIDMTDPIIRQRVVEVIAKAPVDPETGLALSHFRAFMH